MPRLPITTERLALFGTLLATFGEMHPLCDHWVQGSTTASRKRLYGKDLVHADGTPAAEDSTRPAMTTSALGRRAVVCHVASYTAVQLAATIGVTRAFGYRVTPAALLSRRGHQRLDPCRDRPRGASPVAGKEDRPDRLHRALPGRPHGRRRHRHPRGERAGHRMDGAGRSLHQRRVRSAQRIGGRERTSAGRVRCLPSPPGSGRRRVRERCCP